MCLWPRCRLNLIADTPDRVVYRIGQPVHEVVQWSANGHYMPVIALLGFIGLTWAGDASLLMKLALTALEGAGAVFILSLIPFMLPIDLSIRFRRWPPAWRYMRVELDGAGRRLLVAGERPATAAQESIAADAIGQVEVLRIARASHLVLIYGQPPAPGLARPGPNPPPPQLTIHLGSRSQAERLASHIRRFFQVPAAAADAP